MIARKSLRIVNRHGRGLRILRRKGVRIRVLQSVLALPVDIAALGKVAFL
jgi:hypothetical protein